MVSAAACVPAQGAPRSSVVGLRVAPVSPPESGGGFVPLRSRSDFDRVFAQGTRRRRGGLTAVSVQRVNDGPVGARIGLVVSRRVGGAVDRNRAKRRLRAALREMPLAPDHDQVVIATRAVVTVGFVTLRRWLTEALVIDEPNEPAIDDGLVGPSAEGESSHAGTKRTRKRTTHERS